MDSRATKPIPGRWNKNSTTTVEPMTKTNWLPMMVTMGTRAFLRT